MHGGPHNRDKPSRNGEHKRVCKVVRVQRQLYGRLEVPDQQTLVHLCANFLNRRRMLAHLELSTRLPHIYNKVLTCKPGAGRFARFPTTLVVFAVGPIL